MLDTFYPLRTVTVTNRDPYFVTRKIKSLLRKRNRLMHRGRIEKAKSITKRISQSIIDHAKVTFSPSRRGSKELWEKVWQITHKTKSDSCLNQVTVAELNQHFATISTDQHYIPPLSKSTVYKPSVSSSFTEYHVFRMLDQISTSAGLDNLPHWFLQMAASPFSLPLSHLFNLSLKQSIVPAQWKTSIITAVPKVNPPLTCSDYRPIFITPILARRMEKSIVKDFLYPILVHPDHCHLFHDQFAFRPTGSTTAALIYLLHTLTELLQTNDYVHVIAFDFSKAFDSVRHHSLASKLTNFTLPDHLYNWTVNYLSDRQHQTKLGDSVSPTLSINAKAPL